MHAVESDRGHSRRKAVRIDPRRAHQLEGRVVPRPSDSMVPSNKTVPG